MFNQKWGTIVRIQTSETSKGFVSAKIIFSGKKNPYRDVYQVRKNATSGRYVFSQKKNKMLSYGRSNQNKIITAVKKCWDTGCPDDVRFPSLAEQHAQKENNYASAALPNCQLGEQLTLPL